MNCGLLGRKLGHSYSPQIHAHLGSYRYALFEKEPEELEAFLKNGDFTGLNVTIPYKKDVIPYLDELSPAAERLGAVNTIVRRPDGRLVGHNTDYFGFRWLVKKSGLAVAGKKVLVLGSGGAAHNESTGGIIMEKVYTEKAPAAIGPYSQAMKAGGLLFTSGQIPIDPATGAVAGEDITAQTEQVMQNLGAVLEAAGTSFQRTVKTLCFLQTMDDFAAFNEVYARYFTEKPARSCVAVRTLPKGVLVEVEAIAEL